MELNWSTFILEIINFLVLIWILKHFLYKPVLGVIARRRTAIEKELDEAKVLHKDADGLRKHYENRLTEWDKEKQLAHQALDNELEKEHAQRLQMLQIEIEAEKEKARVSMARQRANERRRMEETALEQGARFVSSLLSELSSPELEQHLIDLFIKEIAGLSSQRLGELRAAAEKADAVVIYSAYPLSEDTRGKIEKVLNKQLKLNMPCRYEEDKGLLAGLRIIIDAWVLHANLADELKGFAECAHDAE